MAYIANIKSNVKANTTTDTRVVWRTFEKGATFGEATFGEAFKEDGGYGSLIILFGLDCAFHTISNPRASARRPTYKVGETRYQVPKLINHTFISGSGMDWALSPLSRLLTVAYLIVGAPIMFMYLRTTGGAAARGLR